MLEPKTTLELYATIPGRLKGPDGKPMSRRRDRIARKAALGKYRSKDPFESRNIMKRYEQGH